MLQLALSHRAISNLQAQAKPYFVRDSTLRGFGVKVNTSGKITYVVELWSNGKSIRKTLGTFPYLQLQQARQEALSCIAGIKSGVLENQKGKLTLQLLFEQYVSGDRLKQRTIADYKEAVFFYLHDWLKNPVASITKQMVEERFYKIRDKGINGGKPTYSQATKTMRILSALMNYAMADEIIQGNPVQVLKLKRVDRSIVKRHNYLRACEARDLLDRTAQDTHPMTQAVHLMLFTGLRKNEALRLKWTDIEEVEGIRCLVIRETKNSRAHYVPVTDAIKKILQRASNSSPYIFPSTQRKDAYVSYERATLKKLSRMIQHEFRCHDLRRTFATRASEVGIDYLMVKRLLNHKSHDITAQYIQWNSRENLLALKKALGRVTYVDGMV